MPLPRRHFGYTRAELGGAMEVASVLPCPDCKRPVSLDVRACPHCGASLLVDVVLQGGASDSRTRFRVARALAAFGEAVPAFSALQNQLVSGKGAIVFAVSRDVAERAATILREGGVPVVIERAGSGHHEEGSSRGTLWIGVMVAAVLLVAIGVGVAIVKHMESGTEPTTVRLVALKPEEVAAKGLPATVLLKCQSQSGSGFFVEQTKLVTNAHVICRDSKSVTVRFSDGREVEGTVEALDDTLDLAVVTAPGFSGKPLPIGDAGALKVGERLTMIGNPAGIEFTVHQCGVSNLKWAELGLAFVQIDAAVNPGNSGGPIINHFGQVVGIVTLKLSQAEGIGWAVPINYVFSGPNALLSTKTEVDTPGFVAMKGRALNRSATLAADLATKGQLPSLVEAEFVEGSLVASVLWPTNQRPIDNSFAFILYREEEQLCRTAGEVQAWVKLETESGDSPLKPRTKAWLEKNGFATDIYQGLVIVQRGDCTNAELARGFTLELEGANEDAKRLELFYHGLVGVISS